MVSTATVHRLSTHLILKHHCCFSSAISIDYPQLQHQHQHPLWSGLHNWRSSTLNHDRYWGPNGPIQIEIENEIGGGGPSSLSSSVFNDCSSLAEMGGVVLSTSDPLTKAKLSHLAYIKWRQEGLPVGVSDAPPPTPSRPPKPQLLNAIDLAWDTVVRFSPYIDLLGQGFFADFAHVADDESRHFTWCSQRLAELGFRYGDMPAHSFLWRECEKSSDNVAARLAVIPLVQEARGLDAGPRLVNKLIGFGDLRTSSIVAKIADEEVAHVAVGVYWFVLVCQKTGRVPSSTFTDILQEYNVELKGPFNYSAREQAGIPREWYDPLSTTKEDKQLCEVYDRLACIISIEQENSSLGKLPK
ncbi:hypothetical protein BUALT_Bualt18G0030300 [Buddleja alternifolia]|uniref:DUF455 domain-containing protein n=1 Tax=Buddleja alternifolia TaxID=168488 RepID=A0AAV6WBH9_9LAMI|nr:hypothetical protein BUALT_Bualt18G0030300 [Buddleja alternifolia]